MISEHVQILQLNNRGFAKRWFPKGGGFGGCSPVPKNGTRVHSDVARYQTRERICFLLIFGAHRRGRSDANLCVCLGHAPEQFESRHV